MPWEVDKALGAHRGGVEPGGRVCQGKGKAVRAWTLRVVRKGEAAWEGGWGWPGHEDQAV